MALGEREIKTDLDRAIQRMRDELGVSEGGLIELERTARQIGRMTGNTTADVLEALVNVGLAYKKPSDGS